MTSTLYQGLRLPPQDEMLEIPTGTEERFNVQPYKLIAEPYSTRKEVATVSLGGVQEGQPQIGDFPSVITVAAAAQGETTIVLPLTDPQSGTTFERRITVLVTDQISPAFRQYISRTLNKTFPSTSVEVVVANGRTVLLTGFVDRQELVQPIVNFVRSALNSNTRAQGASGQVEVVNALKVTGAMQVQLKVVFATVNRTKLREMGLNWNWQDLSGPFTANLAVQLPGHPGAGSTIPFSVTRAGVFSYLGFFQALQSNSLGKILAEPTLVAMSGTPAFFNAGQNFPIVTPGGTVLGGSDNGGQVGGGSVTFVPIGTNLRFVPYVLGNGRIRLEVRPEVSQFVNTISTPGGGQAPVVDQRVAETTIEMEAGQTFVLGGLLRQQTEASINKLPVLGDMPLFGWAFQHKRYNQIEEELVIMVTPAFADALAERPCKLPGRESRIPNDKEFFLGSKIEPPCFVDPYEGDWKKDWTPPEIQPVLPYDNYGRPSPEFVNPQPARPHLLPSAVGTHASTSGSMIPKAKDGKKAVGFAKGSSLADPASPPVPSVPAVKRTRGEVDGSERPLGAALWSRPAPRTAEVEEEEAEPVPTRTRRETRRRAAETDSVKIISLTPEEDASPVLKLDERPARRAPASEEEGWKKSE
ncbi:MAG TPA: hypothetical protein VNC50_15615 [Planctomycetia bacterium]|nr:hypothetical protein [Planctomycetia bacterium]